MSAAKRFLFALGLGLLGGALVFWIMRWPQEPAEPPLPEKAAVSTPLAVSPATSASLSTATATALQTKAAENKNFAQKLESVHGRLTTVEQIRALPEKEKHRTPETVIRSGLAIGEVTQAIEADPSLAPQGLAFYEQCAKRSDLPTSLRATCLSNLRSLSQKMGLPTSEEGIPAELGKLVDQFHGNSKQ